MSEKLYATFDPAHVRVYREQVHADGGQPRLELIDALEISAALSRRSNRAPTIARQDTREIHPRLASRWARRRGCDRHLADTIAGFLEYVMGGRTGATWSCAAGEPLRQLVFDRLDPEIAIRREEFAPAAPASTPAPVREQMAASAAIEPALAPQALPLAG